MGFSKPLSKGNRVLQYLKEVILLKASLYRKAIFFFFSFPFLGQMIQVFLRAFNLLPSERVVRGTAMLRGHY